MSTHTLDEMNAEELGKIFPIFIAEPDANWPAVFEKEKTLLLKSIPPELLIRIEHIGSTAVPGLAAKPTIDILLEVNETADGIIPLQKQITNALEKIGYHCMIRPENLPPHLFCVKGYTVNGFEGQAFHIHVRYAGNCDEIVFRDYLRAHPETAKAYADLKKELAIKFRNNRELYTEAKTEFIRDVVRLKV